jgi:hypothetical protein
MRTSIWYRPDQHQPESSGYYLSYRGWGLGGKADGDSANGYLWYSKKTNKWYEYQGEERSMHPRTCMVYYWTDATPDDWVDNDQVRSHYQNISKNPTLKSAWQDVLAAIEKFKIIEALVKQA